MSWNRTTMTFLLLRKNTKLLNEYISKGHDAEVRSQRREYIISLKQELAALPPERYNLIKTVATEIDRFIIKDITKNYVPYDEKDYHVMQHIIQGTNIVLREEVVHHYMMPRMWLDTSEKAKNTMRGQPPSEDPWILYDKIHNIHFLIYDEKTVVDKVDLFTGREHGWFIGIFKALQEMKEAEEEIMKQQRVLEELRKEERRKAGILSKYS
ncbi:hypothetical protein FDG95_gp156 [Pectobacterium phage vB_PcaM_CBB]|uniref:Uncharacterized protein n=1 Tax=Pectobacterium phage vB_PcaM_CBB TaxID=2772511 RepID=A0A1L2CUM5_9CAUD|nr:hypothetical protein FDG95_gp156 [Pectobacterium phage vB_PcaM_CBB]AMM43721.1 hypothetical protein CBB_156 [Pectobacterium phage vB_PcaM_CBB]